MPTVASFHGGEFRHLLDGMYRVYENFRLDPILEALSETVDKDEISPRFRSTNLWVSERVERTSRGDLGAIHLIGSNTNCTAFWKSLI